MGYHSGRCAGDGTDLYEVSDVTIAALERSVERLRPAHLIVLARLPDGSEQEMSAAECVEAGAEFIRVLRGNDLHDLDLLLSTVRSLMN